MLPVLIYGAMNEPVTQFLILVCEEKGAAYCVEPVTEASTPAALQHQGHQFCSAVAAAAYLDALLPETPLVPEAADTLGAMWESLLARRSGHDAFCGLPMPSPYLIGDALTLADLYWFTHDGAAAPLSDDTAQWQERIAGRPSVEKLRALCDVMGTG